MQEAYATPFETIPPAFLRDVVALAAEGLSKEEYAKRKLALAKKHGIGAPQDSAILMSLPPTQALEARSALRTHPVRTESGVTVVAVMTKPMRCPHGKCTYCPGGPSSAFGDTPQSYTGHEPAALRGARAGYDAYVQVFNRLEQYIVSGHNPEKVEIILMGGTFPLLSRFLIRTSGEHRTSSFFPYQADYAELSFIEEFWPDLRKEDFVAAVEGLLADIVDIVLFVLYSFVEECLEETL